MVFTKTAVLAVLLAAVTVASAAVAEVKEEVSAAVHNVKADAAVHTGGYYGKPKPKPKHHYPKHPKYGGYGGYGGYGYSYRQASPAVAEEGGEVEVAVRDEEEDDVAVRTGGYYGKPRPRPRYPKHPKYGGYGGYGGYGYSYRQAVERGYKKPRHHKHAKYGGYGGYGGYNGYGYY
jgi:hypothetical protein